MVLSENMQLRTRRKHDIPLFTSAVDVFLYNSVQKFAYPVRSKPGVQKIS